MKIALDAMGGDLAPQAAIQGAINTLKKTKDKIHDTSSTETSDIIGFTLQKWF